MVQALAFTQNLSETARTQQVNLARAAIVLGSGLALILAGEPLPLAL
ncbi:MAG: hypothetical protein ABJP70_02455 [Erythrobacter sp.]